MAWNADKAKVFALVHWFYNVDDVKDICDRKPRLRKMWQVPIYMPSICEYWLSPRLVDFLAGNELMLSDHHAVIDVTCIQGISKIKPPYWWAICWPNKKDHSQLILYDDREVDLDPIDRMDQFCRWSFSTKGGQLKARRWSHKYTCFESDW
jgi:hypothetical protein